MKLKKVLSAILCIAMVLGTMSFTVFAENETAIVVSTQEELATAIENAVDNTPTTIELKDGAYTPFKLVITNKDITFKGGKNAVIDNTDIKSEADVNALQTLGSSFTFDGVTVKFAEQNEGYQGIKDIKSIKYNDCVITGTQFMYCDATFTNCVFECGEGNGYNVYGRGIGDGSLLTMSFTYCTFNSPGRAIMLYQDQTTKVDVNLTRCIFNENGKYNSKAKAAVETGDGANKTSKFTIIANDCTVNGYDKNVSDNALWGNKDSMPVERLTVVIDGVAHYGIVENVAYCYVENNEALEAAVANASSTIPTIITLADGNYDKIDADMADKNITIKGSKNAVIDYTELVIGMANNTTNTVLTFDGVTVKWQETESYQGIKNQEKLVYRNCDIYGLQYLYGETEFIDCTFYKTANWSVWTYASEDVTFDGCTFNTGGHAVLNYNDYKIDGFEAHISFTDCKFNNDGTVDEQWGHEDLVETGANPNNPENKYYLSFSGCEVTGSTNQNLWGNKNNLDPYHFSVTIDGVDEYGRSLTVVVEEDVASVDEEIVAKVVVNGENMFGADWEFKYNPNEFYCAEDEKQDGKIDGIIKGNKFSGTTPFTDGQAIASYTLKVLPQTDNNHAATLEFTNNSKVGSDKEVSTATPMRETVLISDTVEIVFKTFDDVKFWVDGVEKTTSPEKINYDGKAHTFAVTVPEDNVTISYDMNNIINIGTYEITYTIKKDGYADKVGKFTIEIVEPTKEIEIVPDFVTGKVAVLVYTNIDDISYEYEGKLMVDVTAKSYTYNGDKYTRVFGYVTEPLKISGTITLDKTEYEKKLAASVPADENLKKITNVDCDLNDVGGIEFYDVIAGYGVYNARTLYFTDLELMKTVFKADVNCDKAVKAGDAEVVYNALYKTAK